MRPRIFVAVVASLAAALAVVSTAGAHSAAATLTVRIVGKTTGVVAGTQYGYTLTVRNAGKKPMSRVVVRFVPSGGEVVGGLKLWTFMRLPPGSTRRVIVRVRFPLLGPYQEGWPIAARATSVRPHANAVTSLTIRS